MSEVIPLNVTLELPASEFIDHDNSPLVRCPKCRKWVPMRDYYSEKQGQLLPLVGNASCSTEKGQEWFDTGKVQKNPFTGNMEPVMEKQPVPGCQWSETVRVLEAVIEAPPEGGTLEIAVHDAVGAQDKFGG